MRSILTRRSRRRAWWGGRAVKAQSAPSEVAQTDVAWHALLQNSSPTFTHLDAGAGGTYAGGAAPRRSGVPAPACPAPLVSAEAVGGPFCVALAGVVADGVVVVVGGCGCGVVVADVDVGAMEAVAVVVVVVVVVSGNPPAVAATRPGGAPANITSPP